MNLQKFILDNRYMLLNLNIINFKNYFSDSKN